jgi:hypothetical protein
MGLNQLSLISIGLQNYPVGLIAKVFIHHALLHPFLLRFGFDLPEPQLRQSTSGRKLHHR